ncbi:MAG TPA: hypothetical protein VI138_05875, partial [Candidatus Dormibacteraeota bacterium]
LLGLAAYLLVVSRFEVEELFRGRGDHWVAGGALAIATLAGGELWLGLRSAGYQGGPGLEGVVVGLWVLASLWIAALIASEVIRPRLGYHHLRWATVFPLGMYGVCSLVLGRVAGPLAFLVLGRVFVWVALAAWLLVLWSGPGKRLRSGLGRAA